MPAISRGSTSVSPTLTVVPVVGPPILTVRRGKRVNEIFLRVPTIYYLLRSAPVQGFSRIDGQSDLVTKICIGHFPEKIARGGD